MSSIVALDVGGTSIKTGVVAVDGNGWASGLAAAPDRVRTGPSIPTRSTESADVVLGQLALAVMSVIGLTNGDAVAIAVAFPGPFDVAGGRAMIRGLHKFESIYGVDLREALRTRLDPLAGAMPIEFARDSESAGVGEAVLGAGRGGVRVLTVTIGTGLGSCLTDAGRVVEVVGDLEIEKLAQRPTTGGRADDVLSARGLAARLGVETSALGSLVDEPVVREAIRDHGRRLGEFLEPVVLELDVDLVVVGGGLVGAFDLFGDALRAELGSAACEPATLGAKGPLVGAALLAFPDRFPAAR